MKSFGRSIGRTEALGDRSFGIGRFSKLLLSSFTTKNYFQKSLNTKFFELTIFMAKWKRSYEKYALSSYALLSFCCAITEYWAGASTKACLSFWDKAWSFYFSHVPLSDFKTTSEFKTMEHTETDLFSLVLALPAVVRTFILKKTLCSYFLHIKGLFKDFALCSLIMDPTSTGLAESADPL